MLHQLLETIDESHRVERPWWIFIATFGELVFGLWLLIMGWRIQERQRSTNDGARELYGRAPPKSSRTQGARRR